MKYLMWLLKAAIFFTLFAFALNNQQTVSVHFFFGTLWQAPLVLVVLVTFACGLSMGILVMMPRWWKNHKAARPPTSSMPTGPAANHPAPLPHGI
ncbi:MAG: LapA family protein [Polaromonas sp.]|nr:LapA family protein [Polaromonas sp.]